jgi:hypothetical protein
MLQNRHPLDQNAYQISVAAVLRRAHVVFQRGAAHAARAVINVLPGCSYRRH